MTSGIHRVATANPSFESCRCKSLIPKKKRKPHPPFNSGVPIGFKRGMHPLLVKNSSEAPAPGSYDPSEIISKCPVTSWEREEATKEFSATMGGKLSDKYVIQRDLMKRGRGPGTHEIKQWPEIYLEKNCGQRDTGFGIASRFESFSAQETPGPGYTGREHNPYYYVDKRKFVSHSSLPTFEFDGLAPRFEYSSASRGFSIACNRYKPRHPGCLEETLRKRTGRRGPYDLFTGPRDDTTIVGYFAPKKSLTDSKNWPILLPTEFEKAVGGPNRFKGVWTVCQRFTKKPTVRSMMEDVSLCYRDPDSPGPGSYDPVSPIGKSMKKFNHPFNDSVKNARPLRPNEISPGPGSYDPLAVFKRCSVPGNGWTYVFKSKVQRRIGPKVDKYNSF